MPYQALAAEVPLGDEPAHTAIGPCSNIESGHNSGNIPNGSFPADVEPPPPPSPPQSTQAFPGSKFGKLPPAPQKLWHPDPVKRPPQISDTGDHVQPRPPQERKGLPKAVMANDNSKILDRRPSWMPHFLGPEESHLEDEHDDTGLYRHVQNPLSSESGAYGMGPLSAGPPFLGGISPDSWAVFTPRVPPVAAAPWSYPEHFPMAGAPSPGILSEYPGPEYHPNPTQGSPYAGLVPAADCARLGSYVGVGQPLREHIRLPPPMLSPPMMSPPLNDSGIRSFT